MDWSFCATLEVEFYDRDALVVMKLLVTQLLKNPSTYHATIMLVS